MLVKVFWSRHLLFASHINQTSPHWPRETNPKINMFRSRYPWHHRQLTLLNLSSLKPSGICSGRNKNCKPDLKIIFSNIKELFAKKNFKTILILVKNFQTITLKLLYRLSGCSTELYFFLISNHYYAVVYESKWNWMNQSRAEITITTLLFYQMPLSQS